MKELLRPSDLSERERHYHATNVLTTAIPAAWMSLHTFIFFYYDVPVLAHLGVVISLLMYFAVYLAAQRKYLLASGMSALLHVILIGAGMVMIGWKSGMQFHLIAMGISAQINLKGFAKYKFALGAATYFAFLGSAIYTTYQTPIFLLPEPLMHYLLFFNIALPLGTIFSLNVYANTFESTEEKLFHSNLVNEQLLHNILPKEVAIELREKGSVKPARFEDVTIMFSDFKGFTNIVATIPTAKLIEELNEIFSQFDDIMESEGIEKIQTIGDGYLAACGLPVAMPDHAIRCVRAGLKMINYLDKRNDSNAIKWKVRIGLHSGPISAGVIGKKKFAYSIFGDTINTASRIESAGEESRINVSAYTYGLIKEEFPGEYRGKLPAKGKGELDMYFVK